MSKVGFVTDSTAYIPDDLLEQYPITVVPALVIWSGEELRDHVDIQADDFYARLATAKEMPTTSQPSPGSMKEAMQKMLDQGYDDLLVITISSKLSGTFASAQQGAEMIPEANIKLMDSKSSSMGLGWQILAAARAAEKGASIAECLAIAENVRENTDVILTLNTLEFLHRGGRIGGAKRFVGQLLKTKPILELKDGVFEGIESPRTRKKALARLMSILEDRIGGRTPLRLAILHSNDHAAGEKFLEEAKARFKPIETVLTEISPAVGTHLGPGIVGAAFAAGVE